MSSSKTEYIRSFFLVFYDRQLEILKSYQVPVSVAASLNWVVAAERAPLAMPTNERPVDSTGVAASSSPVIADLAVPISEAMQTA